MANLEFLSLEVYTMLSRQSLVLVHVCEWYSYETIGTEKYQTVWLALVTCKTAKQTANMKDF